MPRRFLKNLLSLLMGMSWLAQGLAMTTPVRAQAASASSALAYPCSNVIYDFADGAQGWKAQQYSQHRGKIWTVDTDLPESPLGTNGLSLELNLDPGESAEFWVDLLEEPPDCAAELTQEVPWWEPGSVLSVWVWAPKGTRGEHTGIANGLHLFAIDRNGQQLYGTWQHFQEETWFEVTLHLDGGRPACGTMGYRFDFQHIKKLGLNIYADSKVNYPIKDTIRISPIQVKSGEPVEPESSHRYLFDEPPAEGESTAWRPLNDEWEAEAITANGVQDGALFLDTHFTLDNKEIGRKAVMGMVFAPALNLSNLKPEQDVFSLDVKFETAPDFRREKCPFALKLWASNKSLTFGSDDHHVGYDRWVHVSFRLKDFIILDEEEREAQGEKELDLSKIDQIGFQIYGKIPYQGRIWVDNIAIGGIPQKQDPIQLSFVKTDGPHFSLDGQRFRFLGQMQNTCRLRPMRL
jgi:hypothetical protein